MRVGQDGVGFGVDVGVVECGLHTTQATDMGRYTRRQTETVKGRAYTNDAARVVVVEHAERYGRKNAGKVQEESGRYGLVQRVGADEPCNTYRIV